MSQPQLKKLHELIALAKEGKKFTAHARELSFSSTNHKAFLNAGSWSSELICAVWEYRETKEPRVIEFTYEAPNLEDGFNPIASIIRTNMETVPNFSNTKWKAVFTEVIE